MVPRHINELSRKLNYGNTISKMHWERIPAARCHRKRRAIKMPMTATPDFQLLFESSPTPYLVLMPDFTIAAVSGAYLQATMTKREEIVGRPLFEIFPDNPADPGAKATENLRASLNRVLATRQPDVMAVQKYDIRRPKSEGGQFEERWWSPANSPILDKQGNILYILHHVEDVTEYQKLHRQGREQRLENAALRTRGEQMESEIYQWAREVAQINRELVASRLFLKNIIDNVADPIFVKDRRHRWIDGNAAFFHLMGRTEAELLGKSDYDFFPKEEADVFWQKDEEVFARGEININVENFTDADGKTHVISTKKACFRGADGALVLVGIIRDISDISTGKEVKPEPAKAKKSG